MKKCLILFHGKVLTPTGKLQDAKHCGNCPNKIELPNVLKEQAK